MTVLRPTQTQDVDNVEAKVTQHFAHLHGVLQNLEQKIIESLRSNRCSSNKNFDEILMQLNEHKNQLQYALVVAESVTKNLDKIDIQQVIRKLEPLVDIPCHLVVNILPTSQEVRLDIDETIVDTLENHCSVHLPGSSNFSLKRTDSLPDICEMETLSDETDISSSSNIPDQDTNAQTESTTIETVPSSADKSFPAVGSSETVQVSHIYDPSCFYVQPIQNRHKLMTLNNELAASVNTSAAIPTTVILNSLYIAQYSEDMLWYRGRITGKKMNSQGCETYTVFFIDYGTIDDNVPLSRLRNITPQHTLLPPMALKCTLHDVVPNNGKWHPDAINAFKDLVYTNVMNSMCIMMINGNTYYVDLCVISARDSRVISVKDSLTYMKYATYISPDKLTKTNPYSPLAYYKEQLELKTYTNVEFLYIESPKSIYVQKKHASRRPYFVKMLNEMSEDYEKNVAATKFISAPCKDLPCAARGLDGRWHRGLIIEVTENTAKVFYVDIGYTLTLNHNTIRALAKKYMSCNAQAIKISLKDVEPPQENNDQWQSEATEFLNLCLKHTNVCKIIAFDKFNDTYNVVMYVGGGKNVAHLLTSDGPAFNKGLSMTSRLKKNNNRFKKNSNDANITGEPYDSPSNTGPKSAHAEDNEDPFKVCVVVHHVLSPDCIYVSDATCNQSNAEQAVRGMQELDRKRYIMQSNTWNEETICSAYCTKTQMYHHARINDIKSSNEADVFFYDIGIAETVPLKHILLFDSKSSERSTSVFKVKLTGILPCGGSNVWPSLSCEKLRNIIMNNQNCKFYISKLEKEEIIDSTIPVELWIKQTKMDGPLAPTRHEINSVNRMLVEEGVALPVKEYAMKRDRILAIELKRQLFKKMERLTNHEMNVKGFDVTNMLESSVETDVHKEISGTSLRNSDNDSDTQKYNMEKIYDNFPSLPKLSEWLPVAPISEDIFIAIPTYLDYNGYLYLHHKPQNAKIIQYIETKLEATYNNYPIESCDTVWAAGDMCIAQYHANNKWYRGKVIKVHENDTVEVEFVDYGNVEMCSVEEVRKKVVLEDIPIQCTKCMIYGLIPATENGIWLAEDLDKIHSLLVERECEVTVIDRTKTHLVIHLTICPSDSCDLKCDVISFLINTWNINIKRNTEITVAEKKVFTTNTLDTVMKNTRELYSTKGIIKNSVITGNSIQFPCRNDIINDNINAISMENLSLCTIKDDPITSTAHISSEETLLLTYKIANIPEDVEYIEIELCCSISVTEFFAQLTENTHAVILNEYHVQYEHLMAELQKNACKQRMITTFTPNTPCCAKFDDNMWYRCLITECELIEDSDDVMIKLLYVDYGNTEYRTINTKQCDLYSLKEEWFDVPIMAIKCMLWNVEVPHTINFNELLLQIQEMYGKHVIAKIKNIGEEFMSVELYENSDCKEVMYNKLIDEGLLIIKSDKN